MFNRLEELHEMMKAIDKALNDLLSHGNERKDLVIVLPISWKNTFFTNDNTTDTLLGVDIMYDRNIPEGNSVITKKPVFKLNIEIKNMPQKGVYDKYPYLKWGQLN